MQEADDRPVLLTVVCLRDCDYEVSKMSFVRRPPRGLYATVSVASLLSTVRTIYGDVSTTTSFHIILGHTADTLI